MRALRTFKNLPCVEGVPDDWYTQSINEDTNGAGGIGPGGRDGRDKRRPQLKRNPESGQGMTPHSETHPKVKDMMKEYYQRYDWIMGGEICRAAGVNIWELDLNKACLNFILGKCNFEGCTKKFRHVKKSEATQRQVDGLCNKLRPGVIKMTREKRRRGGN